MKCSKRIKWQTNTWLLFTHISFSISISVSIFIGMLMLYLIHIHIIYGSLSMFRCWFWSTPFNLTIIIMCCCIAVLAVFNWTEPPKSDCTIFDDLCKKKNCHWIASMNVSPNLNYELQLFPRTFSSFPKIAQIDCLIRFRFVLDLRWMRRISFWNITKVINGRSIMRSFMILF